MEELRLPWSNREGLLYGGVIAGITCVLMATFNIVKSAGRLDADVLMTAATCIPVLWVIVMLLMTFVVGRVAAAGVAHFAEPTDGFNARILMNLVFCVTMMSVTMTFIGPFVGSILSGHPNLEGLYSWPVNWPVNFCVAFWIEMLVAQPAARAVMKSMHLRRIAASSNGGAVNE